MPNPAIAFDAFKKTFRNGRLWLIQIFANAALFGLFVLWLWIPVATTLYLGLNVLVAILFVLATLVLQAGTLHFLSVMDGEENSGVAAAFRSAMRSLPAFTVSVALLCVAWYFAGRADVYEETLPNYLRSMAPQFVRNLLSLHLYENVVNAGLFALQWIIAPGLFLPFLAATSLNGFSGFARKGFATWIKCIRNLQYWAVLIVCAVVGVYLSGKIMDWKPDFRTSTASHETASLIWRGILTYFLILWAWLLASSLVGSLGRDAVSYEKSVTGQSDF